MTRLSELLNFTPKGFLAELDKAGYVIVPKEPTEAQLEAGYHAEDHHEVVSDLYRQMIAAGEVKA